MLSLFWLQKMNDVQNEWNGIMTQQRSYALFTLCKTEKQCAATLIWLKEKYWQQKATRACSRACDIYLYYLITKHHKEEQIEMVEIKQRKRSASQSKTWGAKCSEGRITETSRNKTLDRLFLNENMKCFLSTLLLPCKAFICIQINCSLFGKKRVYNDTIDLCQILILAMGSDVASKAA